MYQLITEHGPHSTWATLADAYDVAAKLITAGGYQRVIVIPAA